jgi:predicted nucleic acid-binding protein
MIVLDTNVISELMRARPEARVLDCRTRGPGLE